MTEFTMNIVHVLAGICSVLSIIIAITLALIVCFKFGKKISQLKLIQKDNLNRLNEIEKAYEELITKCSDDLKFLQQVNYVKNKLITRLERMVLTSPNDIYDNKEIHAAIDEYRKEYNEIVKNSKK